MAAGMFAFAIFSRPILDILPVISIYFYLYTGKLLKASNYSNLLEPNLSSRSADFSLVSLSAGLASGVTLLLI